METPISLSQINPAVRYVNHICFPEGYTVAKRILFDHEFLYCLFGEARMDYQGHRFLIRQGDLFHLAPFLENRMEVEAGKRFAAHCVHFDFAVLDPAWDFSATWAYFLHPLTQEEKHRRAELSRRPNPTPEGINILPLVRGLDSAVMVPLFRELYCTYGRSLPSDQMKLKALFLQILSQVFFLLDNRSPGFHFDRTADEAIYYMKEHYSDPITAVSLADHFGLSPKYFGSLFKKSAGMSIQKKLLSIRMEHASQLLIDTRIPIEEVAAMVGIPDVFYFTKLFKQERGMPPGQYRKMLQ